MNLTCRLKIYLVAVAALFLLPLAAFSGEEKNAGSAEPEATPARSVYENLELFTRVMEIVNEKYVDDINRQKLIYGALQGMMKSLDDYSQFMEARHLQGDEGRDQRRVWRDRY